MVKVFVCVPSCIPAALNFETSGAELTVGVVAIHGGKVIDLVEMPIAERISNELPEIVCRKTQKLQEAWRKLSAPSSRPS